MQFMSLIALVAVSSAVTALPAPSNQARQLDTSQLTGALSGASSSQSQNSESQSPEARSPRVQQQQQQNAEGQGRPPSRKGGDIKFGNRPNVLSPSPIILSDASHTKNIDKRAHNQGQQSNHQEGKGEEGRKGDIKALNRVNVLSPNPIILSDASHTKNIDKRNEGGKKGDIKFGNRPNVLSPSPIILSDVSHTKNIDKRAHNQGQESNHQGGQQKEGKGDIKALNRPNVLSPHPIILSDASHTKNIDKRANNQGQQSNHQGSQSNRQGGQGGQREEEGKGDIKALNRVNVLSPNPIILSDASHTKNIDKRANQEGQQSSHQRGQQKEGKGDIKALNRPNVLSPHPIILSDVSHTKNID